MPSRLFSRKRLQNLSYSWNNWNSSFFSFFQFMLLYLIFSLIIRWHWPGNRQNLSSEEKVIKRRTNFQILFFHPFSLTILHTIGLVYVVQILFCVLFVGLLSGSKVLKANNYECVQRICIYRLLHYYTMSRQNSICNNVYNKTYTKSDRKYMCRYIFAGKFL